ncbi:hypothetical protein UO65_6454 [Actinokineospora spheciospongiae]|uniref:Uncharacterized protein n=1 Tax=Actinokineospora spheciospongiae TaxID=909613 RepID=W7IBT3_9PSEU|nr:hypothetical protein [Actinokineospora spheciospongiae]EWC58245.1 hypothetical protein UO65_6454 [Actinokineospora spheciospongiae]
MHADDIRAALDQAEQDYRPTGAADPTAIIERGRRIQRRRRTAAITASAFTVVGVLAASFALMRPEPVPPAVPGPAPSVEPVTTVENSPVPRTPQMSPIPGTTPAPGPSGSPCCSITVVP